MGNKIHNPIVCAELLIDCSLPQEWCVFDIIFQSTDISAKWAAVLRDFPVILGDENTDFFKTCFVSRLYYNLHHRMSTLFNSAPYVTLKALVLVTVLPLSLNQWYCTSYVMHWWPIPNQNTFSGICCLSKGFSRSSLVSPPCETQMSSRTKKVQWISFSWL